MINVFLASVNASSRGIGEGRLYWGPTRPAGLEIVGAVYCADGRTGALIRTAAGFYAMGNAGALSSLPNLLAPRGQV